MEPSLLPRETSPEMFCGLVFFFPVTEFSILLLLFKPFSTHGKFSLISFLSLMKDRRKSDQWMKESGEKILLTREGK